MALEYEQLPDQTLIPEPSINANNESLGQKWTFAKIGSASSGLVVRIGGGPWKGVMRSGADLTATDDDVNYIVAARSNGALTIDTDDSDWNDSTTYGRVGTATFAAGVLTYLDCRDDPGGIFDHGADAVGAITAADVPIVDAGTNFVADNVEDALAELADALGVALLTALMGACSDEETPITTGVKKITFVNPFPTPFVVVDVLASLRVAQTSGSVFTVDINEAGASILSTKITIDNGETVGGSNAAAGSATPAVISDASIAAYAEVSADVDQIGASADAAGLKVYVIGYPT